MMNRYLLPRGLGVNMAERLSHRVNTNRLSLHMIIAGEYGVVSSGVCQASGVGLGLGSLGTWRPEPLLLKY